jgi:phenylacetic acid degradation operon negative regulatory protein
MSQARNNWLRPLTARSVIASTLLGLPQPRLPAAALVASGEKFGVAPGTTRVALSRMVDTGELTAVSDGVYELAGPLLARHARQVQGRHPRTRAWKGDWRVGVVVGGARSAADRAALRRGMASQRFAELREGVWIRPDNVEVDLDPACVWFVGPSDEHLDVDALFGLDEWAATARLLLDALDDTIGSLRDHDADALGETFIIAAATTRHLTVDPLLPPALLPPDWPGGKLRNAYDEYQDHFSATWRHWYRSTLD